MIVDDFFLQTAGGPSTKAAVIGDRVVMYDPLSGRSRAFRVAAIAENDYLGSGAFVSETALREVFQERAVPSRFFVAAEDLPLTASAGCGRRSSPTAPTCRRSAASSRPRSRRAAGSSR